MNILKLFKRDKRLTGYQILDILKHVELKDLILSNAGESVLKGKYSSLYELVHMVAITRPCGLNEYVYVPTDFATWLRALHLVEHGRIKCDF